MKTIIPTGTLRVNDTTVNWCQLRSTIGMYVIVILVIGHKANSSIGQGLFKVF